MGKLINGKWSSGSIISSDKKGAYDRKPRTFRDSIINPESNRYHLYVSYACPWANRTLIYRKLKDLETHISVDVVHPDMMDKGWSFQQDFDGSTGDTLYQFEHLYQLYQKAQSDITSSVTVPVLWDKKTETIVNNESSEIIRLFNSDFNSLTGNTSDYYPEHLRSEIDTLNHRILTYVNNGVYRTGFAKTQEAYNEAVTGLFTVLDELEALLSDQQYLFGETLTEADLRLIPTLLRFDLVYYIHFKCSIKKISEYKNLSRYTHELYQLDAIKETTNFAHISRHYYYSHSDINPYRIVPKTPAFIGI
jgi:putative glutathione S-transferase